MGSNLLSLKLLRIVLPEPMPFDQKVASAIGDALVSCQVQGTLVVFKDSGPDGRADGIRKTQGSCDLSKHTLERK